MVPHYVVGIDQSPNHTGVAILNRYDGSLALSELIEHDERLRDLARLVYIRDRLYAMLPKGDIAIGVWESYAMKSTNRPFLLGEVGGIVQLALYDAGARVECAAPKALKKFVTGNASATKAEMVATIEQRWGATFPGNDDNLADAYGLARMGLEAISEVHSTNRAERETVARMVKPKVKKKRTFRVNKGVL